MTCIVGVIDKKNKRVVIGGDSASSNNEVITRRKDITKLFKKGDFLFGCAGDFRLMQILQYCFKLPPLKNKDIMKYLSSDFAKSLMDCYREQGSYLKYDDGQTKGSVILIGYKDRLFKMDYDFHFGESISGIYAIGCGEKFAYGAMEILKDMEIEAEEKVERALKASEYYSMGVASPFIIETT